MHVKASTFLLIIYAGYGVSLECYYCHVKPKPRHPSKKERAPDLLCSEFDGSARFLVNCTASTFCRTRTYSHYHFQHGDEREVRITERGCAHQSYSYQTLDRGKWTSVTDIKDNIAGEGCFSDKVWAGRLSSGTQYCYCSTDRCNKEDMGAAKQEEDPDPRPEELQFQLLPDAAGSKKKSQRLEKPDFESASLKNNAATNTLFTLPLVFLVLYIFI